MENRVYQACYTRVGATGIADVVSTQSVTEGYQNIHCSSDIPERAQEVFDERRKTISSASARFIKKWGISYFCDKNIFAIEGLQFDLKSEDRSGGARPCFFDQTFLIEDAYELLKNPEELVFISEDNFGIDLEKASDEDKEQFQTYAEGRLRWCIQNTAAIPSALRTDKPQSLTVDAVCAKYGITRENYITYIKSVYHQLFSIEAQTTIFVKTDGSTEMMKDLYYLLLVSLPYSIRVKISAGEYCYENQKGNNVYFTDKIPASCEYVDPVGGVENVLKNMTAERFDDRYPYIMFALSLNPSERDRYFDTLAQGMEQLGLGAAYNWQRQHLKMIHLIITDRDNPDNLIPILYDLLKYPVSHNGVWETLVSESVQTVIKDNIQLSEEMEKMLMGAVTDSGESMYAEAVLDYESNVLEKRDIEAACSSLIDLSSDKVKFARIVQRLFKTANGQALMHEYYRRRFSGLEGGTDGANLAALANSVRSIKENGDLLDMLADRALKDSIKALDKKEKRFEEAERDLKKTTGEIYGGQDSSRNHTDKELKDHYYNYLMSEVGGDLMKSGEFLDFFKVHGKEYPDGVRFLKALNALNSGDIGKVEQYFDSNLPAPYADRICRFLISRFKKYEKESGEYIPLSLWLDLSKKLNTVPANLMIDNKAMLIFDPNTLDYDLDEEAALWTDNLLRQTIDVVKARMKEDPRARKQLKDSLDILKTEVSLRKKGGGGLLSKFF